jgi:hypothetical protein
MADYGTLSNVKLLLNINTGATEADLAITRYLEESDEFINTRVTLMNGSSPTSDQALDALGEGLAASLYNYWVSPSKSMEGIKHYKEGIVNHLKALFSGTMEQETTQDTFSKTASRTLGTA